MGDRLGVRLGREKCRTRRRVSEKRRTHVIRIFPNEESALRLIRALGGRNPRGLDRSPPLPEHGNAS